MANVPSSVVTVPLYSGINPGDTATYTVSAWNATGDSPQSPGILVRFPGAPTSRTIGLNCGSYENEKSGMTYNCNYISRSVIPTLSVVACAEANACGCGLTIGNILMAIFTEVGERLDAEKMKKESTKFDLLHLHRR